MPETPERVRGDLKWESAAPGATLGGTAGEAWTRVEREGFLTFADAYRIALPQRERLARAAETYAQALSDRDRAFAAVLPTVTVQGTQLYQQDAGVGATTAPDRTEFKINATQPLFQGFREFSGWGAAAGAVDQKRWAFETERRALYAAAAQAFYTTLFRERETAVVEAALKNARNRVREMQARHEQGMARRTEVLLIETQTAAEEAQWIRARQGLDRAKRDLELLLGRPLMVTLRDAAAVSTVSGHLEDAVRRAYDRRTELKEAESALRTAEEAERVAGGAHWPSLDFAGNYYGYRRNFSASQQATTWDVQLVLSWPLFAGGAIQAQADQAASAKRAAMWQVEETRRRIALEVRNAWTELEAGANMLTTLETRERTARDAYTQVLNEYRQGLAGVTNLEVSVAQDQWLNAQIERDRQRVQRQLDGVAWELAQGLGVEEDK